MQNQNNKDEYEKIKKNARNFYKKVGSVWCPALDDHVVFRDDGFRHLIWRGSWVRAKKQQIKRLSLIPDAVDLIRKAKKIDEYRNEEKLVNTNRRGIKSRAISEAQFWGLNQKIADKDTTVVIRQIGKGQKHFFSVFEHSKKQKTAPK